MTGRRRRPSERRNTAAADPPQEDAKALAVWIQPRASGDAVVGEREGMVAIRLQAPPVDGAANTALLRFLARVLGCPTTSVRLLRSGKARSHSLNPPDPPPWSSSAWNRCSNCCRPGAMG